MTFKDLSTRLALDAIKKHVDGEFVISSKLDFNKPETITNFNIFGHMLATAYMAGASQCGDKPVVYVRRGDLTGNRARSVVASYEIDGDWNIPLYTKEIL